MKTRAVTKYFHIFINNKQLNDNVKEANGHLCLNANFSFLLN